MFEDPLVNALILITSLIVLDRATNVIVNSSIKISEIAGYGKTTVGFIVIAFCSSLPALSVSVIAALTNKIDIAVGNAVGSNLVNVSLIFGICLILATLKRTGNTKPLASVPKKELLNLYFGLFIGSAVPLSLMYLGYADRYIGVFLLAAFLVYTYTLLNTTTIQQELSPEATARPSVRRHASLAILSAIFIVIAAYFMVNSASAIAEYLHIDRVVIAGTIVALATSVSVLLASARAILRGHPEASVGNIAGSVFVNTTLILGASLAVYAASPSMTVYSNVFLFSAIANLFAWYFLADEKLGWKEGLILATIYLVFLITSFSGYRP